MVTSPDKISFVTPDKSPKEVRSPLATSVDEISINLVIAALVLPALSVWVTVIISSPSPKLSPASLAATVKDQVPLPETVVVRLFPSESASKSVVSEWPLPLKAIETSAPTSPVPEIVKPSAFSIASIMLSVATTSIPRPVGITLSTITPERVAAVLTFPAASVAVTLTV